MATATQLSKNDSAVLGAILDPEAGLGGNVAVVEPKVEPDRHYDSQTLHTIQEREKQILLPLNSDSPSLSTIEIGIAAFDSLLEEFPNYAAGYNNRAQARRLLHPDLERLSQHSHDLKAIFEDLAAAIRLASPDSPVQPVSPQAAKVLSSAYTHRGYLLYKASQPAASGSISLAALPDLAKYDREELIEMASRDFALGGRYGNKAAKQLAVHTNPYAKLCGSIVKEALQKEMEAFSTGITTG
ncbi:L-tyrosine degradation gene cluster protein hmgX [Exophiala dermatitidis]